MKKIICVIPITILFILLSSDYINVFAVTLDDIVSDYNNVVVSSYNSNETQFTVIGSNNGLSYNGSHIIPDNNTFMFYAVYDQNPLLNTDLDSYIYTTTYGSLPAFNPVTIKGHVNNLPDPPAPPGPVSSWYDDMFDEFIGAIEGIASVATGGFSNLVEAFTEFWVVPVGGDEGDMFFPTDIPIASPTPTPTPISYQTVIAPTTDPQGNVYYEYKYVYNNPSGTPIITSSPPVDGVNGIGDSFDYPYYENPENKDNPYKLKIPWFLKLIFGDKIVDETTLDDSVNVIQDYMNDDDINDGVNTVYDGMSAIPTDWLILIGVIASIPLFGCLISRLLS